MREKDEKFIKFIQDRSDDKEDYQKHLISYKNLFLDELKKAKEIKFILNRNETQKDLALTIETLDEALVELKKKDFNVKLGTKWITQHQSS